MSDLRPFPLAKLHQAAQATFGGYHGFEVPLHYGNADSEYEDLVSRVGVVDFSFLTLIRACGKDRADYLNRRLSQLILDLSPGEARRATLLDGIGKMQADMEVFALENEFLILAPPRAGDQLAGELDKYVFAEDCQFENVTDRYIAVAVIGPRLPALLESHGLGDLAAGPRIAQRSIDSVEEVFFCRSVFVPSGLLLMGKSEDLHNLMGCVIKAVEDMGGHLCGFTAFDSLRIEQGCPWWGRDLDPATIPLEADLHSAIHLDKGCYPGQETIARITNLGHPARKLVRITCEASEPFAADTALVFSDGKKAGRITSSARSPRTGTVHSLAMVKWPYREPGTELIASGPAGNATVIVTGPTPYAQEILAE